MSSLNIKLRLTPEEARKLSSISINWSLFMHMLVDRLLSVWEEMEKDEYYNISRNQRAIKLFNQLFGGQPHSSPPVVPPSFPSFSSFSEEKEKKEEKKGKGLSLEERARVVIEF